MLTCAVAAVSVLLIDAAPDGLFSWYSAQALGAGLLLLIPIHVVHVRTRELPAVSTQVIFQISIVSWWFLLSTEQIFSRSMSLVDEAAQESFSAAAYGEAASWLLVAVIIGVVTAKKPQYLSNLIRRPYGWMSAFAASCLASVLYSPMKGLSLAWTFKLVICLMLLHMLIDNVHDTSGIRDFFTATALAFLLLTAIPYGEAIFNSQGMFNENGRLNALVHPLLISEFAGVLMLLSLVLHFSTRSRWTFCFSIFGGLAMLVAGGKAAILAGVLCGSGFLLLRKRRATAFLFVTVALLAGVLAITFTPLSKYFFEYAKSGGASSLSGRTTLWLAALPEIRSHLLLGQGYLASRLLPLKLEGANWALHMHNSFMEVLYNNGLAGLVPILALHTLLVRNLFRLMQRPANDEIKLFSSGCLVLYLYLFVNGIVEVTFGGKASAFFMLFLALLFLTQKLLSFPPPALSEAGRTKTTDLIDE